MSGSRRVFRGGSWVNYARYCRGANRDWVEPAYRYVSLGFRVVYPVRMVIRSASFVASDRFGWSSLRYGLDPSDLGYDTGFRRAGGER